MKSHKFFRVDPPNKMAATRTTRVEGLFDQRLAGGWVVDGGLAAYVKHKQTSVTVSR